MKKWISMLLAVVMLMSGAALAGTDPMEEMTALTLQVKQLLQIPDTYDNFYGDFSNENGKIMWNLSWQGQDRNAWVSCDDKGKIYSYNRYEESWYAGWSSQYEPRLPVNSPDEAQTAACAFLDMVLDENEGYVINERSASSGWEACYFYGTLTRDGILTETGLHVEIRMEDLEITSFSRGDGYARFVQQGAMEPVLDADAAAALLAENYAVELRYVSDGENQARLVYMAVPNGGYLVDAVTGEVIRRDEEYVSYTSGMGDSERQEAAAADTGLTQAEMEGIARMEGVRSEEELDGAIRAMENLGVTQEYTLIRVNYSLEEGRVCAQLQYEAGDEEKTARYIRLDARDMKLVGAWTSHPYQGEIAYEMDADTARALAEPFAEASFPEKEGQYEYWYATAQTEPWAPVTTVYFVRVENGVRFEGNTIAVEVDTQNRIIDGVTVYWDEDMVFPAPENIAGAEEARDAFFAAHLPELVQAQQYLPQEDSWTEILCYRLGERGRLCWLDAETLEPVTEERGDDRIVYEDGEQAGETARVLAEYGIGYGDGSFRGEEKATLRDVLRLLLSAQGASDQELTDELLLQNARSRGFLDGGEYDLDAAVSRCWLAKTLVRVSGYGTAAPLTEIYHVGFADADQLETGDEGYIAIARGMGIAEADSSGCFHPNRDITRAEAVNMLYAFLTRKI